jgi:hypothetical protein
MSEEKPIFSVSRREKGRTFVKKNSDTMLNTSTMPNTCLFMNFSGKHQLIYNRNMLLLSVSAITLLLGAYLGLTQEKYFPNWDMIYIADIWSIAHIFISFALYCFFLFLLKNDRNAVIVTFLLTLIYEPVEYYFSLIWNTGILSFLGEIGGEILNNSLMDIVFNAIGILIAFFIFRHDKCDKSAIQGQVHDENKKTQVAVITFKSNLKYVFIFLLIFIILILVVLNPFVAAVCLLILGGYLVYYYKQKQKKEPKSKPSLFRTFLKSSSSFIRDDQI